MAGISAGSSDHRWRFFRSGGLDQVRLDRGADLRALETLDPKLWAALSCPTRGLEFATRTLDYIDADRDGRIRRPEIVETVRWACAMLKNPDDLTRGAAALELAAIDDSHDEGRQLLASARQILHNLGKNHASAIGPDDTADITRIFAHTLFNGDGVIPTAASGDATVQGVIKDIITCVGSVPDRSGEPGVNEDQVNRFFADARAFVQWHARAESDAARVLPLGDATAAAYAALHAVAGKVDDFFARCRLATFDARAAAPLNRAEKEFETIAAKTLSVSTPEVAEFPLAKVEPDRALPLREGLNPAWSAAIATLRDLVVTPLLGAQDALTDAQWNELRARFGAYAAWQAERAGTGVDALGAARVCDILSGNAEASIRELLARDKALEPEANSIVAVDKLVHLHRDLYTLLNNFVALRDFYSGKNKAIFQAGTLYLDGRSCELCIRVHDVARHSAVATLSRTYLAYCDCTRRGGGDKMTIAAAFTAGDSDQLLVGRNGLFYDRNGDDWDATIVKIIEHPISIRQAFWSPYKRIGRMIGEQIEKMAAARDKAVQDKAAAGVADASKAADAGKAAAPAFDVGKFAGIFAAIGLAIGAIGTAIASVVTGFFGLAWWQMPLALVGLVLVISGPSMIIAAMKLRQRNLGPLLDANGWAVNARARINLAFGAALTAVARLPPGAERSVQDPFAERSTPWGWYLFFAAVLVAAFLLWQHGYLAQWFGAGPAPEMTPPPPATP